MDRLNGKRVTVIGLARQGVALARFLTGVGALVTVTDVKPAEALAEAIAHLSGLPVRYILGGHPVEVLEGCELLCLSGGVSPDIPIVQEARRRGIPLSNDALLTLERCPAAIIGITGSSGKTTTTTLAGEMLKAAGYRTWVGGNIGLPLIDRLSNIRRGDLVVMELSSFQTELFDRSPHVAAILNVTPNHLDRHPSMETYTAAKANLLRFQGPGDVAVLGYDNPATRLMLERGIAATALAFSVTTEVSAGAFLRDETLVLRLQGREEAICRRSEVRLRGMHNVQNLLAAACLAGAAGAPLAAIARVARTFAGVEHRLELVRMRRGARWYNDSIATTPERVVAALRSFTEPIVLLAGGRDKHLPWDEFAQVARERVRSLILFGEAAGLIQQAMTGSGTEGKPEILRCGTLEEAVQTAANVAQPGDVVLLSPGGTSFDAFCDFAERGERFKALARLLPE
ncbi:MAG: UDP-N-acetylmuramoyl-L-alanine--D-glutamate ligase [Anaerolineae bacterium]|nr:UDP-N-acetylmuramoyl-L-alanine--D-glutamate ligase [Anaerolineae bacterium]